MIFLKNTKIFTLLILLSIGFSLISILLYFMKNNDKLLSAKLKTGALIISLTSIIATTNCNIPPNTLIETCYMPARSFIETKDTDLSSDQILYVDLSSDPIIDCAIYYNYQEVISYSISRVDSDSTSDILFKENISLDSSLSTQNFSIALPFLSFGFYSIKFYFCSVDFLEERYAYPAFNQKLIILDK